MFYIIYNSLVYCQTGLKGTLVIFGEIGAFRWARNAFFPFPFK